MPGEEHARQTSQTLRKFAAESLAPAGLELRPQEAPEEYTVTFSGGVEKRECLECGKKVIVPEETPHVWCPCEDRGVPFFEVKEP